VITDLLYRILFRHDEDYEIDSHYLPLLDDPGIKRLIATLSRGADIHVPHPDMTCHSQRVFVELYERQKALYERQKALYERQKAAAASSQTSAAQAAGRKRSAQANVDGEATAL
jgi:hypothetical protein